MTEIIHLDNAPIKEAIIDLRVEISEPDDAVLERLATLATELSEDYPGKIELNHGNFGLNISEEQTISTDFQQRRIGFRLNNQDENQVVQLKIGGFTFSRLEPYETWEQMQQEAKRLWDMYFEGVNPTKVTRVATRFINVIRIPLNNGIDFDKILTAAPQVPENLPQGIGGFMTRVIIPYQDCNAAAIVAQAFEGLDNGYVPITLDIDVFSNLEMPGIDEDYWSTLEKLRNIKNDIFRESVRKETLELFK